MRPIGALLFLAVLPIACDQETRFFSDRRDVAAHRATRGERTFKKYCAACHGADGGGDGRYIAYSLEPKPPDFGDLAFQEEHSDELLRRAILEGSQAVGGSSLCPPWGHTLASERVEDLVHVIRSHGRHPGIGLRDVRRERGEEEPK